MSIASTALSDDEKKAAKRKTKVPDDVESDFVWGAEAIGAVIGLNEKQTFHLLYSGALAGAVKKIKTGKEGGRWVGSRRKLRALLGG